MKTEIQQVQEQTIKQGGVGEGEGKKPQRWLWLSKHGKYCSCPDCRRYYTYEDGKIKEKSKSIVPMDKHHELDVCEYIKNRKVNKFIDAYHLCNIEK